VSVGADVSYHIRHKLDWNVQEDELRLLNRRFVELADDMGLCVSVAEAKLVGDVKLDTSP